MRRRAASACLLLAVAASSAARAGGGDAAPRAPVLDAHAAEGALPAAPEGDPRPRVFVPRLDQAGPLRAGLLSATLDASTERPVGMRRYVAGRWGSWRETPLFRLTWAPGAGADGGAADGPERSRAVLEGPRLSPGLDDALGALPAAGVWAVPTLAADGMGVLWQQPPKKPIRDWRCRRRPVTIARYGGESDTFPLVLCDGSIAPEALDRLSILMRPPNAPDPGELLPDEPSPGARSPAEWLPRIRVAQPRLVWLLQSLADAFPWKPIHIYSGYRPAYDEKHRPGPHSHASLHGMGRAVDIKVLGVPNQQVFQVCRKLPDVGCGFYPNGPFVHVDVRRPGTGHALWIDVSGPGEAPRYVDSWPGVVDKGARIWVPGGDEGAGPAPAGILPPGMGGAQAAP